jgi:hypothetical protein
MTPRKSAGRPFGTFFIMAFISYGTGLGLIDSVTAAHDSPFHAPTDKATLVIGVILTGLATSFFNIGLAVIMLPIWKPHSPYLAYGYLCAAILATVILAAGAIF